MVKTNIFGENIWVKKHCQKCKKITNHLKPKLTEDRPPICWSCLGKSVYLRDKVAIGKKKAPTINDINEIYTIMDSMNNRELLEFLCISKIGDDFAFSKDEDKYLETLLDFLKHLKARKKEK